MKIYSSTIHLMNSSYNTIKKYENKNKLFNNIFLRERRNKKNKRKHNLFAFYLI